MATSGARPAQEDPFAVLGVSRDCTLSELKRAYRTLARRYHPDVNASPEALARMQLINWAFESAQRQVAERLRRSVSVSAIAPTSAAPVSSNEGNENAPTADAAIRNETSRTMAARARARASISPRRHLHVASALFGVALLAVLVLLLTTRIHILPTTKVLPHSGRLSGSHAKAARAESIKLDAVSTFDWPDVGSVAITERYLAPLGADLSLTDRPQWSYNRAYTAVSVVPSGGRGARSVLIFQGKTPLPLMVATYAAWSPVADVLALSVPNLAGGETLELVTPGAHTIPDVLELSIEGRLAWSSDGTHLAYTSWGERDLRLVEVATKRSALVFRATAGQRLQPIGWLGSLVACIERNSSAVSLLLVDPATHGATVVATVGSAASDSVVTGTDGEVTLAMKSPDGSGVQLTVQTPQQQSRLVELAGLLNVRFLPGESPVGGWFVASPAPAHSGTSTICFAHSAVFPPPARSWVAQCVTMPGTILGMNWEPHSSTLGYVSITRPGATPQLREIQLADANS